MEKILLYADKLLINAMRGDPVSAALLISAGVYAGCKGLFGKKG